MSLNHFQGFKYKNGSQVPKTHSFSSYMCLPPRIDDPSSLGSRRVGKISWMLLSCCTTDCPLLPVIMEERFARQGSESVTWLENMHKIWHLSMCFVCMFVVTQVKVTLGIWNKDNWTTFCLSKFWGIKTANNLHYYSWLWSRGKVWLLAIFSFFLREWFIQSTLLYNKHHLMTLLVLTSVMFAALKKLLFLVCFPSFPLNVDFVKSDAVSVCATLPTSHLQLCLLNSPPNLNINCFLYVKLSPHCFPVAVGGGG